VLIGGSEHANLLRDWRYNRADDGHSTLSMKAQHWVGLTLTAMLAACTLPRRDAPTALFSDASPPGFPSSIRFLSSDTRQLAHLSDDAQYLRTASTTHTITMLALSGGGSVGAFGAGALIGLSHRGTRPEFQVVTGVSAGALLAPFAYLGPSWDPQLIEAFSGRATEHLLRPRGLAVLFHPGWYRGEPLEDVVDHFVTDKMVEAVARERARGRILAVATTDLDSEETVIWDLGKIAAVGGEPAKKLFRDVLVASASIPDLFPPVMIKVISGTHTYDEMHVDGGTTTPFFNVPEATFLTSMDPAILRGGSLYVLVNGQLSGQPQTTRIRSIPILSRSFAAALKHTSRTAIIATAEFAEHYDMSFRFTSIPLDHAQVDPLDFRRASMQALMQYGERCAESGLLWLTLEQSAQVALTRAERLASEDAREAREPAGCPVDAAGAQAQNSSASH
jgi:predicted acylesterase/phospholipase RssA